MERRRTKESRQDEAASQNAAFWWPFVVIFSKYGYIWDDWWGAEAGQGWLAFSEYSL